MPVSSLGQTQQIIQNLAQLRSQGDALQQQLATGIQSQSYSGYPTQAAQIVNLNALQAQQQSYIDTINSTGTRLQTMSLATSTMTTLVQQFTSQLDTNAFNTSGTTIQSQAQALLADIGDYLNTSDGEGYIFSGSATGTAPYNPAGLPSPGDLATVVSAAPPAGYYQGNDVTAQARVDTNLTVQYGVTADNPAFEQVIRVLNFLANSPPLDPNSAADQANVSQAEQLLTTSGTQLQQLTAQIGMQQNELNTVQQLHNQTLTLAKTNIANIEQVDPATVITQLDTLQTQMQASYQTVSILQTLSLANYLK